MLQEHHLSALHHVLQFIFALFSQYRPFLLWQQKKEVPFLFQHAAVAWKQQRQKKKKKAVGAIITSALLRLRKGNELKLLRHYFNCVYTYPLTGSYIQIINCTNITV